MKKHAESAAAIRRLHTGEFPRTALILGSGLGGFGDELEQDACISYADIPHFPVSTVAGHAGRLLVGRAGGTPLVCMQGRMHYYEGYDAQSLAVAVRTLHDLGVERLIVTNAAGGIADGLGPGTLMLIEDHINLTGLNPLIGPNDDTLGPRFFDMTDAWDPAMREMFVRAAEVERIELSRGVYLQTTGPSFETPAEVRMMGRLGADAVGMSTVPECLVARHLGMRVVGLSLITNHAAGKIAGHVLSHEETMEEADRAYGRMRRLILRFLELVSAEGAGR